MTSSPTGGITQVGSRAQQCFWAFLLVLSTAGLTACSNAKTPDVDDSTQDTPQDHSIDHTKDIASDTVSDTVQDQPPTQTQAQRVLASWGTIETIAGVGDEGDKGENNWRARDEGAQATRVDLSRPHIAMADLTGNVYIADKDAHAVRMVRPDGTMVTVAGTSSSGDGADGVASQQPLSYPNGLWVKPDGTFYVWDLGNLKIRKVLNGQMTTLFEVPSGGSGRGLWVSEDETQAYVSAGTTLYAWEKSTGVRTLASGFSSLANIHVDPKGQLGVADRGASRVWLIDRQTGDKTLYAGNGSTDDAEGGAKAIDSGLYEVRGLWFHPDGGALVATHKEGKVWYIDDDGVLTLVLHGDNDRDTHGGDGERFDSAGKKISEPRAVTMTPSGGLLVTENDRGFIRHIKSTK